ncbi:MAG TPA: NTP transferase domain-containing protein [Caldilineaceae bacterium]|nr:NTP transferase domain-containing protein [Caldilineaceae bacterium]
MQTRFDVVILAGQDPDQHDPLALHNGVSHKVLIEIAGQPMIHYVVQALIACPAIERIVVIGLEPQPALASDRLIFLPGQGKLLDNVVCGFSWLAQQGPADRYVLLTTGDLPLVSSANLEWFLQACQPLSEDIYWGIVEERTMAATFPASRRSYLRLVEGRYCNGGLMLGTIKAVLAGQAKVRELVAERKHIFRQVRMLGFGVVFKFLLRRLSLADAQQALQRLVNLRGAPVMLPFAETGMELAKLSQLELVRARLVKDIPSAPAAQMSR